MRLSRTVGYALQATLQLAQTGGHKPVPCSRLAAEGQMPERFLLQILRSLVTHGILQSTRGVDGGYSLDRTAAEISLLDVIEAIDGPLSTTLPPGQGLSSTCQQRLQEVLQRVTEVTRQELASIKLAHLLAHEDPAAK